MIYFEFNIFMQVLIKKYIYARLIKKRYVYASVKGFSILFVVILFNLAVDTMICKTQIGQQSAFMNWCWRKCNWKFTYLYVL